MYSDEYVFLNVLLLFWLPSLHPVIGSRVCCFSSLSVIVVLLRGQ